MLGSAISYMSLVCGTCVVVAFLSLSLPHHLYLYDSLSIPCRLCVGSYVKLLKLPYFHFMRCDFPHHRPSFILTTHSLFRCLTSPFSYFDFFFSCRCRRRRRFRGIYKWMSILIGQNLHTAHSVHTMTLHTKYNMFFFVRSALLSVKYKGREKKYFRLNARWQWRWMRWGESQVARQSVYKRKMDRKSIFMWLNDFDNGQIYAHILCICCCESARTHDNKCKYVAITSIILFFVRSEGEHRMKWQRERSTIVISKMFTLNFRFTRISTFSNGEKKNGKEK